MPHRIQEASSMLYHFIEGGILAFLLVLQSRSTLSTLLSDKDWERLSGTAGLSFASTIAVIVLWAAFLAFIHRTYSRDDKRRKEDISREDARREEELELRKEELKSKDEHYKEIMILQRQNTEEILRLNSEVIKAHQISVATNAEVAKALKKWASRPCLIGEETEAE